MGFKLPSFSGSAAKTSRQADPDTAIVDDLGTDIDVMDPLTEVSTEAMQASAGGQPAAFGRDPARDSAQDHGRDSSRESARDTSRGATSQAGQDAGRSGTERRERHRSEDDVPASAFDDGEAARAFPPVAEAGPRRQVWGVPWLSRQPLQRQANLLLTLIVISVVLAGVFGALEARLNRMQRLQIDMVNTAQIESQRLSKSAAVAATGNDEAFTQLRDSSRLLAEAIGAMKAGGQFKGQDSSPLPAEHQAAVVRADRILKELTPDLETILRARTGLPLNASTEGRNLSERSFLQGEQLGDAISAIRRDASFAGHDSTNLIGMIGFAVLSIIGFLLLGKAYYDESWRQAAEAQEQRAEAERLEQEAKRINDVNQSAILRLMNELQEVADGDLTVQATVSEDITGAIADSVNYTVEELRDLVGRINRTAAAVADASNRAQMTSSSLQAASDQQSREIRETGEAVLAMASQIKRVSESAAQSAQVARQSLAAADTGRQAVENSISGMNGIRDQIQETAKRIKRLGESSQEIGEIIELISDITEQTNVLALNAAIQAASAGEAGRGFTIVAEEVQRLAEKSAEATRQISALVKAIQTDTHDAVAAMERSTQGVVEGARLSDEAGTALGGIGEVSRELADLIMKISRTTEDQAVSAEAVAQSIQRILLVTEQTSEGTQQTAGSILQLAELARELKNSVARFRVA